MNYTIFNERPECQDRLIKVLEGLGYKYVSRAESEEKRQNLRNVLFVDELTKFLNTQNYSFNGQKYKFSGESIVNAIRAIDASLLQGLSMASKEIYNLLTLGISVEEKVGIDNDMPTTQSFDLHFIDLINLKTIFGRLRKSFRLKETMDNMQGQILF